MNTIIKFCAAAALTALFASGAAGKGGDCDALAGDLARAAKAGGLTRLAFGQFAAGGGAEEEARYASEKVAAGLAAQAGLEIMDQSALEALAGSKDGWLAKIPSKARPQAIIKGSVFVDGNDVTVMARLVDASTGRVLAALEARAGARFTELPPVPDVNWGAPVSLGKLVADDLRDAPAENGFDCAAAFKDMNRINEQAADLKARYWARKMKEPGFSLGSLSRNPGSEIRDQQTRQKFYELLSKYHDDERLPGLPAAQLAKLEAFMSREKTVVDRCGVK
jgi:TolB-like protein